MASGCCKVCGRYVEYLLIGDFCSDGCKSKFYEEQEYQRAAQRKAEEEKKEQIFRDKVKTAASVASAAMIAEQTAMMKETRRREIAEERARHQEEYQKQLQEEAELEEYCKKVGFRNAAEAREYKERYPDLDVDQLAEKKKEEIRDYQYSLEFDKRNHKTYMDFYKNDASESDKILGAKLTKLGYKLGNTSEFWNVCVLILIPLAILILGLIYRKTFVLRLPYFLRLGGFSAFIFWIGLSLLIPRILQAGRIKSAVSRVLRIKSKSDYPFFHIPDEWYKGRLEIYELAKNEFFAGITLLLSVVPPKVFTLIFHKSWVPVLVWILEIVIGGLILFFLLATSDENHQKSTMESHNDYFIKHHIFEKLGPFVGLEFEFNNWLEGRDNFYESYKNKKDEMEYSCPFLPRYKDEKFIQKYSKCTKSKIYCVEQLYERNQSEKENAKQSFNAPITILRLGSLEAEKKEFLTYEQVKKAIEHDFGSCHGEIGKRDPQFLEPGEQEELLWIKHIEERYGYVTEKQKEKLYKRADKYREKAMKKIMNFDNVNKNKKSEIIYELKVLINNYYTKR